MEKVLHIAKTRPVLLGGGGMVIGFFINVFFFKYICRKNVNFKIIHVCLGPTFRLPNTHFDTVSNGHEKRRGPCGLLWFHHPGLNPPPPNRPAYLSHHIKWNLATSLFSMVSGIAWRNNVPADYERLPIRCLDPLPSGGSKVNEVLHHKIFYLANTYLNHVYFPFIERTWPFGLTNLNHMYTTILCAKFGNGYEKQNIYM